MQKLLLVGIIIFSISLNNRASAQFIITSAIVEFNKDNGNQQDIEVVSRSEETSYVVSEVYAIENPGDANESRRRVEDPAAEGILVTPDKTILAKGSRKVLRFILLHDLPDKERIYRVDVKPVIKGIKTNDTIGIKLLVGYGVLVIVRPHESKPDFQVERQGNVLTVHNTGNTNLLMQGDLQCPSEDANHTLCKVPASLRIYAGRTARLELPFNTKVTYRVWDGIQSVEKTF